MVHKKQFLEYLEDKGIQLQMMLKQVECYLTVYIIKKKKCSEYLSEQTVNFSVDEWSSIHNEPKLCAIVTTKRGRYKLFN